MSNCLCFATLAAASAATIPAGTPAVIVEQWDSNSAVSYAVYTPTLSTANPGHDLCFQPTGLQQPYWVIHPDHVTLEAAGAPPAGAISPPGNDCAPALQRVLNYLGVVTQARLQLWERDYILNSRASLLLPANPNATPLFFSLIGRGRGLSRLVVPCTSNQV